MRTGVIICSLCLLSMVIFCEKNPSSSDTFKNELTLGTGMSGFQLTGVSTTFTLVGGSLQLFWRLESAADMAGADVELTLLLQKNSDGLWLPCRPQIFSNAQNHGHIMVSSITITEPGSYNMSGKMVVSGSSTIAWAHFTVQ